MVGSLALLGLFLLPARGAALRGDDEWTFKLHGYLEIFHKTLLHQIGSDMSASIHRWRPQILGNVYSDPVLYLFDGHPSLYRLYLVALTVGCGGLLWALVRRLGGSTMVAVLAVVLLAGAIQFRSYHDPMLGYYGTTQIALALVLASLLLLLRSLRGGGRRWAVLAVVAFAGACTVHEYVYPLAIAHLGLALTERRGREALRAALPILVTGVAFVLIGYLGRNGLSSEAVPTGYDVSFNIHHVLRSYVTQLFPPLPGSNRLFDQGQIAYFYPLGGAPTAAEYLAGAWRGAVLFAVVLGFALSATRRGIAGLPGPDVQWRLAAVGVPLWIAPPVLLAVSSKYQQELAPGKGYLPVLFQVVGFALVATAVLIGVLRLAGRRSRAALLSTALAAAAVLGLAGGVDGFNNLRIIALEQPTRQTRDLLERAATDGTLAGMPERSTLLFSAHDMNWPTGSWLYGGDAAESVLRDRSGRVFDVRWAADQIPINCPASTSFPPPDCAPLAPSAAWVRVRARRGGGVVIVSRLARPTAATIETRPPVSLRVYSWQSGGSTPPPPPLTGRLHDGRLWSSAGVPWQQVKAGADWAIYEASTDARAAPVAYSVDYPLSHVDFAPAVPPDQVVRIFGTKQLLP